jgi:hypothetical protein
MRTGLDQFKTQEITMLLWGVAKAGGGVGVGGLAARGGGSIAAGGFMAGVSGRSNLGGSSAPKATMDEIELGGFGDLVQLVAPGAGGESLVPPRLLEIIMDEFGARASEFSPR